MKVLATTPLRLIPLAEWQPTELELDQDELGFLQSIPASLAITPLGRRRYIVTPSSIIGAVTTSRIQLVIEPKLSVERIFFMLGYARRIRAMDDPTGLEANRGITEAFALTFLNTLRSALRRGLINGYRRVEPAETTIRGRVRFADQARRRLGLPLPMEITYDEYTVDIEENRLLKAALRRLSLIRYRDPRLRSRIREALSVFDLVSDVRYPLHQTPIVYNRLTERFREPVEFGRLILSNSSPNLAAGKTAVPGLLFDMNKVFEDFVFAAIADYLRPRMATTDRWRQGKSLRLDAAGHLKPEPDLSLWRRGRCVFVGDAKYKTTDRGEPDDLYQLLAYCSASGLAEGMLIYAQLPEGAAVHRVVHGGPRLRVESIDVTLPVADLLHRCAALGDEILRVSRLQSASPNMIAV